MREDAEVQKLADFQRQPALRLGIIRGFRYGPSANRFVDQLDEQHRATYATSLEPLYQILLEGRVQAMVIEPFDYPALESAKLREQTQIVEFEDPPVPHGLIMSRRSVSPAQQDAWRGLVNEMRADGTVQRIFEKYFKADLARTMTQF